MVVFNDLRATAEETKRVAAEEKKKIGISNLTYDQKGISVKCTLNGT